MSRTSPVLMSSDDHTVPYNMRENSPTGVSDTGSWLFEIPGKGGNFIARPCTPEFDMEDGTVELFSPIKSLDFSERQSLDIRVTNVSMKDGELNTSTPVMSPSAGLVDPNMGRADDDHSHLSISDRIVSSGQEQEQPSGPGHEEASDDPATVQPNLSVQAKYDSKENLSYFIDDGMHVRKISKSDIINVSNNDLSSLDALYADNGNTKVVTIKHGVNARTDPKHLQRNHDSKNIHRSLVSKKDSPSQSEAIPDKKVDFVQRNKESVKTGTSSKNKQKECISLGDKRKEIPKSKFEEVLHTSWEQKIETPYADVHDMEQVRGHIQEMLYLSSNSSAPRPYDMTDSVSGLLRTPANDFFPLANTSLLQGQTSPADMSQFLDAMPGFTSRLWSDGINMSRNETSVALENHKLKDTFEKERYRRKHCEHYIQQLNVKLLETQQQLAIAVSTDKRKDLMIEQLDKQLAKVVEGWRKREREKEEYGNQMKEKNQNLEQKLKKQEQIVASFERDLASSIEDLAREKKSSLDSTNQLKNEIESCIKERHSLEDQIRLEREKARLLSVEWDKMREAREQADRNVEDLHEKLHREQDQWYRQEQELVKKLEEVGSASLEAVQHEKNKVEEKMIYIQELDAQFGAIQIEVRKLELELDSATREKESLRVEMGIMESKYENDKRNLRSQMEQEMSEKLAEVQGEMKTCRLDLQENHWQQVAAQRQFQEEMKRKDAAHRKQDQEYEERLRDFRNENSALKLMKQKLETQRAEALTKMQYMMQSQWSEAMSLLSSPQRQTERQSHVPEIVPNLSYSVVGRGAGPQTSSPNRESMASQFTINSTSVRQSLAFQPQQHEIQEEPAKHEATIVNFLNRLPEASPPHQSEKDNEILDPHTISTAVSHPIYVADMPRLHLPNTEDDIHDRYGALLDDIFKQHKESAVNADVSMHSRNHAVAMKPPQQRHHSSQPHYDINEAVHDGNFGEFHGSQRPHEQNHTMVQNKNDWGHNFNHAPFSPPVKQSRDWGQYADTSPEQEHKAKPTQQSNIDVAEPSQDELNWHQDLGDSSTNSKRQSLETDYSHISDKVDQHESRQEELQHYIQVLLRQPPGNLTQVSDHDNSGAYEDNGDADKITQFTGAVDAAQLHRELRKLRQVSDRHDQSPAIRPNISPQSKDWTEHQVLGSLPQEQLEEIGRLLELYKTAAPVNKDHHREKRSHDPSSKQPGARQTETSSPPHVGKTASAAKTKHANVRQSTQQQSEITEAGQIPREPSADRSHMTKDNRARKPERKVAQGRTKSNTAVKSWK